MIEGPAQGCSRRKVRIIGWFILFTVLSNIMNHGSHNIFSLLRSKILQKVKKYFKKFIFSTSKLSSKIRGLYLQIRLKVSLDITS